MSSARNSVSSLWHTNNRLNRTYWVLSPELGEGQKLTELGVWNWTLRNRIRPVTMFRAFFKGRDLNPGERHSRDTRDDGTVTLCTLRAATALSRDCRADFGRPLTKKVMSHSRDGPGVTAPSRTNIVPLTGVRSIYRWGGKKGPIWQKCVFPHCLKGFSTPTLG